jgi:hypothetical protein
VSLIDKMNKKDLQGLARSVFVEVPEGASVPEIRALLHQENLTDEDIANIEIVPEVDPNKPLVAEADGNVVTAASLAPEPEPEPVVLVVEAPPTGTQRFEPAPVKTDVLIKYERQNPSFEVLTYKFTSEHPFLLVRPEDADYIVRNIPGFRPALETEAQEFYS